MKQQVIGTTEYLRLPDISDTPIPTKVDTGADGSAIWASGIEERDGELSFVLFGPQSAYYTGEVIRTNDYSVVRVKNSFGEKEYRFRVKLTVKIHAKKYRVTFTLADRSRNRYPILLGKRFLKAKFLVDVSRRNVLHQIDTQEVERVVVLTSRIDDARKKFFGAVAKESGTPIELMKYRLMNYEINKEGVTRISLPDGSDIASCAMVYFKSHVYYPEHAGTIAKYLDYRHVQFIDQNVLHFTSRSKLSESFMLAIAGLPVPSLRVLSSGVENTQYDELSAYFENEEFILKDAFSDRGKNNFYIQSVSDFEQAVERLQGVKTVIAQKYIPNDGFTRVLLMGGDVAQVVVRKATDHDDRLRRHLNKPRGSANAVAQRPESFDPDALVLAHKAALAMERNVAGVDLIQDRETKRWYVLEVNANPEMTSGYGIEEKITGMAKLLKKRK